MTFFNQLMALFNRLLIALLFTSSPVVAETLNSSTALSSSEIHYIGEAYSLDDSIILLYREEHHLLLQAGKPVQRQVNYYSAEGELIASKENWYRTAATQPDFILTDFRTGYREEAKSNPVNNTNTLVLTLTENQGTENQKTEKTQLSEFDYELVIDAGFDDFIRKHWDALLAGDAIPFSFASVARQTSVNFEVQIRKAVKPGDTLLKLEMTLRSSLLSWLMSPIKLDYDLSNKRLLRYRGLSNLQDDQGSGQQVDIRYRYFDEAL